MNIKYSEITRFFILEKELKSIRDDICDLSVKIRTYSFTTSGGGTRTPSNLTEKNAIRITELEEQHGVLLEEWKNLYEHLCNSVMEIEDEETGYVMWCIFYAGGDMQKACKLACLTRKRVDEIFKKFIDRLKEAEGNGDNGQG